MNLRDAAAVVEPLVAEAGALTLGWFRTPVDAADKGSPHGFDPVTAADQAAEAFLRERLSEAFPDHQIIGEEGGASGPADASARWIIDPSDGTKAFITGLPAWGVLVGLVV
ncbi:MAG: inositol monophosphatase family protein, partial [Acidimicrobiales bacterium]